MEEKDNTNPSENLTTSAFVLLRKLVKTGKLTEAETHEFIEIQKEMPTTSFKSEFEAFKESMDAKMDAQTSRYNYLIWTIGFATLILSAIFVFAR